MGKIGILTFHRSVNNGAVMQAYSLSRRLAQEYPDMDVEIIDYHMAVTERGYHYSVRDYIKGATPALTLKKTVKLLLNPGTIRRLNRRTEVFKRVQKMLPVSEWSLTDDGTERLIQYINETYDVLVVGSDAVWNYVSRGFPNAYFPDERIRCPKLSYAASCYGMEFRGYAAENRERIGQILDGFSFLGVRDGATEEFVTWSGCKGSPVHTCDPTAFLDVNNLPVDEETLRKKLRQRGFDFSRPTIGMMGNDKMCAMIRRIFGKQYQLVALYEYVRGADVNLYDLTPYEWAGVFRYFKLTFTTYFHGTLLSLRNGTPLICLALKTEFSKHHTPKTLDVLNRLGYGDWYFSTDYQGENETAIGEKAKQLLASSLRSEIMSRMDEEAKSFHSFRNAMDRILQDQLGEENND